MLIKNFNMINDYSENYKDLIIAIIVKAFYDYAKIKCGKPLQVSDGPATVRSLDSIVIFLKDWNCLKYLEKMDNLLEEYNYDYRKLMNALHPKSNCNLNMFKKI